LLITFLKSHELTLKDFFPTSDTPFLFPLKDMQLGDNHPLFIPPKGGKICFFSVFFSPHGVDAAKRQRGVTPQNRTPFKGDAAQRQRGFYPQTGSFLEVIVTLSRGGRKGFMHKGRGYRMC